MKICVQTAGFRRQYEYQWVCSSPTGIESTSRRPAALGGTGDLCSTDDRSLILYRKEHVPVLLVSKLASVSRDRRDFNGRPIRNTVAWVGTADDEAAFMTLAAEFLLHWPDLEKSVDEAVEGVDSGALGFQADFKKLENLVMRHRSTVPRTVTSGCDRCTVGPDDLESRKVLAKELESVSWPKKDGPLVVVTENREFQFFEEKGIWRGLSNLVEKTKEFKSSEVRDVGGSQPTGRGRRAPSAKKNALLVRILAICVVTAIIGFLANYVVRYYFENLEKNCRAGTDPQLQEASPIPKTTEEDDISTPTRAR